MVQLNNHTAAFFFFLINALMASIISNKGNPIIISSEIIIIEPVLICSICITILLRLIIGAKYFIPNYSIKSKILIGLLVMSFMKYMVAKQQWLLG